MPVTRKKTSKNSLKRGSARAHVALTPAMKKRLADEAPLFPEKVAKAKEILRNCKNL